MIIYGWGHFNRRDHSVVRGGCPSCGQYGYQKSYTSTKFFTLYFIPVIPLGRHKIIAECPHCKKATGLSWSKWKKLRATELPRLVAEYQTHSSDEEAAKAALAAIVDLQDSAALQRVGPQLRATFAGNAQLLGLLANAYSRLCLDREAEAMYLEAIGASDDPTIAAAADAHLVSQQLIRPRPPNRLLQSLPVLIVPAALLFGLATYVQKAFGTGPETAYVVNGLSRPYRVAINGVEVSLRPFQQVPVRMLVHGENQIAPAAGSEFLAPQTFSIDVPWYRRPFSGRVVVVNPDEAAVVFWERTGYSNGPIPDSAYQYEVACGLLVHTFEKIDHAFEEFPSTITTSSRSGVTYRYRVFGFGQHDVSDAVGLLNAKPAELQAYLRARLRADDGGMRAIHTGAALLPADDFLRLAEPRLAIRPVQVEWHRAAQTVAGRTSGRNSDLAERYRTLVAAEPGNSALLYLLSRVLTDPDDVTATLQQAAALSPPSAYAFHGLAYRHLLDGDFRAALAQSEKAMRLDPTNEQFPRLRRQALHGLRDYETLERDLGDPFAAAAPDVSVFYEHVYHLGKLGRAEQAEREITRFVALLHQKSPLEDKDRRQVTGYLRSALALASSDREAFVASASAIGGAAWEFQRAVVAGDLDAALRLEAASGDALSVVDRLTLYTLCQRAGRTESADRLLEQVTTALADGGPEARRWTEWLRDHEAPEPRLAAHLCIDPDNHPVFLLALAQRHTVHAVEYTLRAAHQKYRETVHTTVLADLFPQTH